MVLKQPIKNPLITQSFGMNPENYAKFRVAAPGGGTEPMQGHDGLDYHAPIGTPIFATHDGFIVAVNNVADGYGLYLIHYFEEDGVGYEMVYGHLSQENYSNLGVEGKIDFAAFANKSFPVTAGQQIGLSGNTGFTTAPHLHFGLRLWDLQTRQVINLTNGFQGRVNPAPYFQEGINMLAKKTLNLDGEIGVFISVSDKESLPDLNTAFGTNIVPNPDGSIQTELSATKK